VKKASEYRKHAQECRALAKRMAHGEQRDQLLAMAQTWDRLAEQRENGAVPDIPSADNDTAEPQPATPATPHRR
jgi:hypothetical protein